MDDKAILAQSKSAYKQWCKQWREHAKQASKHTMHPLEELRNIGIGRAILCIANGYSFEENIETIKEHQDKVDIFVCDKTLGHCLDHGIIPTYCFVADANVSYEKYLEPWKDKLKDTIVIMNVCANPKWAEEDWKRKYFVVHKDALNSQVEFGGLSGCQNFIPAGINVSNAMICLLSQSDDRGRINFFGYDKMLLIGYDYSWSAGKYYAFNPTGDGKNNYMRHVSVKDLEGRQVFTSSNLLSGAQWFEKYCKVFKLPIVQCSKRSIVNPCMSGTLSEQMQYEYKPEDSLKILKLGSEKNELRAKLAKIEQDIKDMALDHHYAFRASV